MDDDAVVVVGVSLLEPLWQIRFERIRRSA